MREQLFAISFLVILPVCFFKSIVLVEFQSYYTLVAI